MSKESDWFRSEFPESLQRRLLKAAFEAVPAADRDAARYGRDQIVEGAPKLRRLELHQRLLQLSWGPNYVVSLERSRSGSSNRIFIEGPRVVLTALTRSQMPRKLPVEPYRSELAETVQRDLFEAAPTRREEKLFSVCLFGGSVHEEAPSLGLARIVFPDPDGRFAPGTIDLMREHRAFLAALRTPNRRATETAPPAVVRPRTENAEEITGEGAGE